MGIVYGIRHRQTGKVYVGSTTKPQARKKQHFSDLRRGTHINLHLQRAFNKHGEDQFEWIVLEEASQEDLAGREKAWIFRLMAGDGVHGYNGTEEPYAPMRGRKHKPQTVAMYRDGRRKGSKHPNSKITESVVQRIFELREDGLTQSAIASQVGLHHSSISLILSGKSWSHAVTNGGVLSATK